MPTPQSESMCPHARSEGQPCPHCMGINDLPKCCKDCGGIPCKCESECKCICHGSSKERGTVLAECSHCHISPQEGWEKRYPLNTFTGETKVELVEFIRTTIASELALYKKSLTEQVKKLKECQQGLHGAYVKHALDSVLAIIKNN